MGSGSLELHGDGSNGKELHGRVTKVAWSCIEW